MPVSTVLIIAGLALFLLGIAKLSSGHNGGSSLRNFGINFFSTSKQSIVMHNATPEGVNTDWIAFATAVIGLATAIFGWFKA